MSKYNIILADPPWWYANRKTGGERKNKTRFGGGAMKHYPLMKDAELVALAPRIKALADDNCALFLWVTDPRKDFGIDLLKCWGFRYATSAFTWVKTCLDGKTLIYGPGTYTASNKEECLLGIKGSMVPHAKMIPSLIMKPRGLIHSRKPAVIYERIEAMYPNASKVELFARTTREGWDHWGNEVNPDIDLPIAEQGLQLRLIER